jgi:hypothetical protein
MAKNTTETEMDAGSAGVVEQAIASGKALIGSGKPKIEAAMYIYVALLGHSQDDVVSAFIEGAALTPKGAVTYWYNCRRKHKRMGSAASE